MEADPATQKEQREKCMRFLKEDLGFDTSQVPLVENECGDVCLRGLGLVRERERKSLGGRVQVC